MRDEEAPGPLTQPCAPTGVPAKSQISWGGMAPGRLGREDARILQHVETLVQEHIAEMVGAGKRRKTPRP